MNNLKEFSEFINEELNKETYDKLINYGNRKGDSRGNRLKTTATNLKRKQYCILNKEYGKVEYEKLREKIIEDMKINPYLGKLGREFF